MDTPAVFLSNDCNESNTDNMVEFKTGNYDNAALSTALNGKGFKFVMVKKGFSATLFEDSKMDGKYIHIRGGKNKCLSVEVFKSKRIKSLEVSKV
eukprot:Pgem_evm1s9592